MEHTPVKVLHIMSGYGGGISSFIRNKVISANPRKIINDIATFHDCPPEFVKEVTEKGGKIYRIPNPKTEGFRNFSSKYTGIFQENRHYDMVHCHVAGHRAFMFYLLSRRVGIKRFIVHAHRSISYYAGEVPVKEKIKINFNQMLNNFSSDQKVSCGKNASLYYFGKASLQRKEIMHIPNSIELDKYLINFNEEQIAILKNENGIPNDKFIVGHIGRYDDNKNHSFLLDIIKKMKEKNMPFFWIFIGSGKKFDIIRNQIKNENLEDYVLVLGRREDAHLFYQIMDVFVLPSYSEGMPTVCVESQASGVPCVVSDTITKEIDMGLGMVEFSPVNDIEKWLVSIQTSAQKKSPEKTIIKSKLVEHKFDNESSAQLYEDFVFQKIDHHEI